MSELIDNDGNVIPPPDASTDVAQLIYLLEYARKRGFKLGPLVQVGTVTTGFTDPRLSERPNKGEPEEDIWEQHGHKDE